MKKSINTFKGCLIGGAIGDALGGPIEFMDWGSIKKIYGESGIQELELKNNKIAEITDDTQMTLFTAEGILRAQSNENCNLQTEMQFAYQRWLYTQGFPKKEEMKEIYVGDLISNPELFHSRAPGNSCISALLNYKTSSKNEEPVNNSKGCGGVIRMAPVGLFYKKDEAYIHGIEFAKLTHGHLDGYVSAGAFAYLIASITDGSELLNAVKDALSHLIIKNDENRVSELLRQAISYAESGREDCICIANLGEGWTGDEALAIAVYCALKYKDSFVGGIRAAVNHDGDSDSTGAITGNILGALLGINAISKNWIEKLELKDVILKMAENLYLK